MSPHNLAMTPMRRPIRRTAALGDVVLAAFDAAADVCTDAREARCLAAEAVNHMLLRGRAARHTTA